MLVITVTSISNTILRETTNCSWVVKEETTEADNKSEEWAVWEAGIKEWSMIELSNSHKKEEPQIKITTMHTSEEKV